MRQPGQEKLTPIQNRDKFSDKIRLKMVSKLSKKVPGGFECPASCGKCCESPVEMLKVEWDDISKGAGNKILAALTAAGTSIYVAERTHDAVRVATEKGVCPFLNAETKACGIYEDRPFVCRAYGQHWFFYCREGVAPPPDGEIPDVMMTTFGALAGNEYGGRTKEEMTGLRKVVEEWRAEKPEERRDSIPTFEQTREMIVRKITEEETAKQTEVEKDTRLPYIDIALTTTTVGAAPRKLCMEPKEEKTDVGGSNLRPEAGATEAGPDVLDGRGSPAQPPT